MKKIKTVLNTTVVDVINCISNLYGDESDGWSIEIRVRNIKDIVTFVCNSQDYYISAFSQYDCSLGDIKDLIPERYLSAYADGVEVLGKNIVIRSRAYEK